MKKWILAVVFSGSWVGAGSRADAPNADQTDSIQVVSQGARTSAPGAATNFTGQARVEQLFAAHDASRVTGGIVTFQPGARSVWHTHPLGQILIVTTGVGLVQQLGAPVHTMKTGDVVWIPAGVKPSELSEIIFHLAFYSGWPNAMAAVMVAKTLFAERGIRVDQLPAVSPLLLPIDPAAEEKRAALVAQNVGPVSQGLVDYTSALLFHDLWLRPDLAPRDRSLITVSELIAEGQSAQISFHLNKAMDNGLSQAQASEILTHLAFYVGWPNAMSAVPVTKTVFDSRVPPGK